jgi:hypothetical protein
MLKYFMRTIYTYYDVWIKIGKLVFSDSTVFCSAIKFLQILVILANERPFSLENRSLVEPSQVKMR